MPVSTETSIAGPYYPNGSTVDFPFAFKASSAGEVVAWDGDGNLISTALYTVTLDDDEGGMLTFGTAPESADYPVIYVVSDPNLTQTANFDNAGPSFNPAALTRAIDRAAIRDLKQQREIDRGFRVPFGETGFVLPLAADRANKFLSFLPSGAPLLSAGTGADIGLRTDLASTSGAALVSFRRAAGANLRTQTLDEYVEGGHLLPSQFSGTGEQQLTRAITEATASRNGGQGQTVLLPRGEIEVSSSFNIDNRVTLMGVNKRGSRLKAVAHSGPYMVTADNGTSSMFDNALERLTLDCNDIAGLGGVYSEAWQEGGGLRRVLIQKFRTVGASFQNGEGGAAVCLIEDSEIFGSTLGNTAGIVLNPTLSSNFTLRVVNTTITGGGNAGGAGEMPKGIHVMAGNLKVDTVHFEVCTSGVYVDGGGDVTLENVTGGGSTSLVTNLVEVASTFTGTLRMRGCRRNGATNLLKDNRSGGFGTISGYDTDITITSERDLGQGAIVASASIDGTGTPAVTKGFGIASITDNGTGDYTITLTRSAQAASDFTVFASTNQGAGNVRCDLNGVNTVRVRCFAADGTTATDVNELKILVLRVA
ncbi:hypothetical protein [Sphingopyxis sp. Geo48]|uniref:hypothetical protein n=1 Tax=Sphingopyxis sp. Geo48 TaxID=545241 RepID=UPI0024B70327|nr:hypothetical protein [Sphingopyxis sp. Geo48]